ncbi:MAG: ATP-binding protein [Blastocatellia bacterium]|nr:ATP-binding protein [Blastocatellia bacterium]
MQSFDILTNPFRNSIVTNPWQPPETDITTIHQSAFARCCQAIADVRQNHSTASVLIHGEAGSGKTHLLARFRSYIAREAQADGPGGLQEAVFIAVRMQTGQQMIWRHLRLQLANDLLRGESECQLERLLLHRLSAAGVVTGDIHSWLAEKRRENNNEPLTELEKLLDQLSRFSNGQLGFGYDLFTILGHLLLDRHRYAAAAWLRGDSLPESVQKQLFDSDRQDDENDLDPEERARRVVLALTNLATADMPLVFCFDQLEALQVDPRDIVGLFAFGQMATELHAGTKNVLIISCIQSMFLETLKNSMSEANYARLHSFDITTLNPLDWKEATLLIEARLKSVPVIAARRSLEPNQLWPLSENDVRKAFAHNACTARHLLNHCANLFETLRTGEVKSPPLSNQLGQFLETTWEERKQQAQAASAPRSTNNTEDIIIQGLSLLTNLLSKNWQRVDQRPRDIDLLFESAAGTIGISLCNSTHGYSLCKKLERLQAQVRGRKLSQLILLRDSRLPLGSGALKTREMREQIIKQGARWVEPTEEALSALDALRQLLSDAKSGALANGGDTVTAQTLEEWLVANLGEELHRTLEEFLPGSAAPAAKDEDTLRILRLLQNNHIISIEHTAVLLGKDVLEIEACARKQTDRIGVLGQPPAVLFHLVGEESAA